MGSPPHILSPPFRCATPGLRSDYRGLAWWEVDGKICAEIFDLPDHLISVAAHVVVALYLSDAGYPVSVADLVAELPEERQHLNGRVSAMAVNLSPIKKGRLSKILGALLGIADEEEAALYSARFLDDRGAPLPLFRHLLEHMPDPPDGTGIEGGEA